MAVNQPVDRIPYNAANQEAERPLHRFPVEFQTVSEAIDREKRKKGEECQESPVSRKHSPSGTLVADVHNIEETLDYGDRIGRVVAVERQIIENPRFCKLIEYKDDQGRYEEYSVMGEFFDRFGVHTEWIVQLLYTGAVIPLSKLTAEKKSEF